jgi:2-phospho-L-lactate guanylyltransferase (CobY/MobA/RfbA family)
LERLETRLSSYFSTQHDKGILHKMLLSGK